MSQVFNQLNAKTHFCLPFMLYISCVKIHYRRTRRLNCFCETWKEKQTADTSISKI